MTGAQELERYQRQLNLPEVGSAGQSKLKAAQVLVVGAGGLGSPVALYLCAAGIGRLGLVDHDSVELSNLQRQIVHTTQSVGKRKTDSARETLERLNPDVDIQTHHARVNSENVDSLLAPYDIVVDGTDNFETRYLVSDACVRLQKPNVYGSILKFEGQASVFNPPQGPCYRCLFPVPPSAEAIPNCAEVGVLGPMAGLVGSIQATETMKLILGAGETLIGKLLLVNTLTMEFQTVRAKRRLDCRSCGTNRRSDSLVHATTCHTETHKRSDSAMANGSEEAIKLIDAKTLKKRIGEKARLCILDVRNDSEFEAGHIENAKHIPLAALTGRLSELNPEHEIVVYCQAGGRSRRAMDLLKENGFKNLIMLDEGYSTWNA